MNNLMEFTPSCDCNRLTNTGVYVQYGYVPKNIKRPKMEDFWFPDEEDIKCPVCGKFAKKEGK